MPDSVVLFPSPGMGHLIPFVELAKLFTTTTTTLSVTIVVLQSPIFSSSTVAVDSLISRVSSSHPSIAFHCLPPISYPSSSSPTPSLIGQLRLANPLLLDFLTTLSQSSNIRSLILDMFSSAALDVANDLNLPAYFFFASGAATLAACLYLCIAQPETSYGVTNLKELDGDTPLHLPGIPPFPASHLPQRFLERDPESVDNFKRMPNSCGIMINSFEELEPRAVNDLTSGLCVPGRNMPPIYCIGPIIASDEEAAGSDEKHECLTWLDAQPKGSVVFLCFGSMGIFPPEQLREIANGLERSEQRFLWVVRDPQRNDDPDLEVLLPKGFVERNRDKGMVVKSWAPQAAVLRHEAVGGFVSHCGWNSTLEALSCGVGMIAWPLYAEQKLNKVILVEDVKVAVPMEGFDKGMVSGEEVERKVRWFMETEGGEKLRARVREMKEKAAAARREGGSSDNAWKDFVRRLAG